MGTLRVLVVDDSAYNRRTIGEMLDSFDGVEVVGKAVDGNDALRLIEELQPDLVTLDLEMPRMDGFTFLRLLMATRPTPVIVISGYANKENVFKALELGAVDFIAKPARIVTSDLRSIEEDLKRVVLLTKNIQRSSLGPKGIGSRSGAFRSPSAPPIERGAPDSLIVIGASTGGPSALVEVFRSFPPHLPATVLVAQHMPEKFTTTFAERLDRLGGVHVREASGTIELRAGMGLVCPGGHSLVVERDRDRLLAHVVSPHPDDRYLPSVDRLFESAAKAMGERVVGAVLTGMGDDGARGAEALKRARGRVLIESPETAVIYGMPSAVERVGAYDEIRPLKEIGPKLREYAHGWAR